MQKLSHCVSLQGIILAAMASAVSGVVITPADESSENLARWTKRWDDSNTGWHKSQPHHFLQKHGHHIVPNFAPEAENGGTCDGNQTCIPVRVFVPLCGKTVDMAFLAEHNSVTEVVGVDGVTKALDEFTTEQPHLEITPQTTSPGTAVEKWSGNGITLLRGDLFDLTSDSTSGLFDSVLDRASLVAIQPSLRSSYVATMGKLLKPQGTILLVTFDRRRGTDSARAAGPPFSVDEGEVRRLYEGEEWVESVTLLEELDEFENDPGRVPYWKESGLEELYELCFVIKAK